MVITPTNVILADKCELETNDRYLLQRATEMVIKLSSDLNQDVIKSRHISQDLSKKSNALEEAKRGVAILVIISKCRYNGRVWIIEEPPLTPTAQYLTFSSGVMKHISDGCSCVDTDIIPLFQKSGCDWLDAWNKLTSSTQDKVITACSKILPKWKDVLDTMSNSTHATKEALSVVEENIRKNLLRLKTYKVYASGAFKRSRSDDDNDIADCSLHKVQKDLFSAKSTGHCIEESKCKIMNGPSSCNPVTPIVETLKRSIADNSVISVWRKKQRDNNGLARIMLQDYKMRISTRLRHNYNYLRDLDEIHRNARRLKKEILLLSKHGNNNEKSIASYRMLTILQNMNDLLQSSRTCVEDYVDCAKVVRK